MSTINIIVTAALLAVVVICLGLLVAGLVLAAAKSRDLDAKVEQSLKTGVMSPDEARRMTEYMQKDLELTTMAFSPTKFHELKEKFSLDQVHKHNFKFNVCDECAKWGPKSYVFWCDYYGCSVVRHVPAVELWED